MDDTMKIVEETQKLQREMRRKHLQYRPLISDQLYTNMAEGKSLRAALLLTQKIRAE
jgi:hypothetical protein